MITNRLVAESETELLPRWVRTQRSGKKEQKMAFSLSLSLSMRMQPTSSVPNPIFSSGEGTFSQRCQKLLLLQQETGWKLGWQSTQQQDNVTSYIMDEAISSRFSYALVISHFFPGS
jgi:hypothetical protein